MAFNWFRRRFDDNPESSDPQQEETLELPEDEQTPLEDEVIESTSTSSPEAVSSETSEETSAEDYLNWAKAAYENLRRQQQAQPEQTPQETAGVEPEPTTAIAPESAEVTASPEPTEPETSESSESEVPESPAIALDEAPPVAPIDEPVSEVVSETPVATDAIAEPVAETSPETPEPETPAAPTPFWARAEAEREARLERLKANAIEEEPEPESPSAPVASPAATSEQPELIPDLAFDEGFLWSAQVLAAQGRRTNEISVEEITWLKRLRQGLDKTRRNLVNQLKAIVGQGPLNQDAVMEIESLLLQADVGVAATDRIIESLQQKLRQEVLPPDGAIAYLKQILREMLDQPLGTTHNAAFAPEKEALNIWLITGVNGAGKTTTIGKLAHIAKKSGYNCLIAAADTFRAAAVEQVKVWGQRSEVEVIANPGQNTDPAAVVFDAITAATARNTELLLVDTAGRLQNKKNLMDELSKVRRIIDKKADNAKIESLLVLDATLGQNGLRQAQVFLEAAQLSGVVLTKLDGTAKGGVALAVVQELGLPIRFIGAGEGIEDLRPFSSYEFVEALLSTY